MSDLSLEEFKTFLFHKTLPEGRTEISWFSSVSKDEIQTTIPNTKTDFVEWAYENRKWFSTIGGINAMKSYFLSLIYSPYDEEMIDIGDALPKPSEEDDPISLHKDYHRIEDEEYDENTSYSESEIMQLFTILMQNVSMIKSQSDKDSSDNVVSADMEVD